MSAHMNRRTRVSSDFEMVNECLIIHLEHLSFKRAYECTIMVRTEFAPVCLHFISVITKLNERF